MIQNTINFSVFHEKGEKLSEIIQNLVLIKKDMEKISCGDIKLAFDCQMIFSKTNMEEKNEQ